MAKNLIPVIAKLLGVELGEQFKIRCAGEKNCEASTYKFDKSEGLMKKYGDEKFNCTSSVEFEDLCVGNYEVVKLPWEPKEGDKYYAPSLPTKSICVEIWHNETCDYALKTLGMVYRTSEEAQEHFSEDYKKLTGKKLEG
ncbi:MAG: hypothetical protein ACI3WS_05420 [Phascolarctobacterium sp.]